MKTKICIKCNIEKYISDFSWRNKKLNRLHSKCKLCVADYDGKHYKKNIHRQTTIKNRTKIRNKTNLEFIKRYKKLLCCSKCFDNRWYVLDFHHQGDKEYEISRMLKSCSLNTIKKEIRKCIPLCANCHREMHFLERYYSSNGRAED